MTDTPSDAAKRKACELANALTKEVFTVNDFRCSLHDGPIFPTLYALALHLDEVDRVVRAAAQHAGRFDQFNQRYVDALRSLMLPDPVNPNGHEAADRISALEAENERLREALELADAALRGANMNMNVVQRKVRAALGDTK